VSGLMLMLFGDALDAIPETVSAWEAIAGPGIDSAWEGPRRRYVQGLGVCALAGAAAAAAGASR
jgi:hypothetical protein